MDRFFSSLFPGQSARSKVSWTDLQDIASLTYPQIAGIGAARTVCSSFANGWLTGVTDAGTGSCPGTTTLATLSYLGQKPTPVGARGPERHPPVGRTVGEGPRAGGTGPASQAERAMLAAVSGTAARTSMT